MNSYSKAPEHSSSPGLRKELLAAARCGHAAEIERGLRWLEKAAAAYLGIGDAVARGLERK